MNASERDFLNALHDLGVPLFRATVGGDEFIRPSAWQSLTADGNAERLADLDHLRDGAVCALTGGPLAVVDVDPRNGGDVDEVRLSLDAMGVQVFAEVKTPGGGAHFYVAGHPDLTTAHLSGVDVQAHRGYVYLPGTRRPKYDGAGYEVLLDDLGALADTPDDGGAVLGWVEARRPARTGQVALSRPGSGPERDDLTDDQRALCDGHAERLIARACDDLRAAHGWPEGHRDAQGRGWEKLVSDRAQTLLGLLDAPWTDLDAEEVRRRYLDAAPVAQRCDPTGKWREQQRRPEQRRVPELPSGLGLAFFQQPTADGPEGDGPSWAPLDLTAVLAGDFTPTETALMPRDDGVCLLYPAKVHSFHGESESGKSMLTHVVAAQVLLDSDGGEVLILDFESDAGTVVGRLRALGVPVEAIRDRLTYLNPDANHVTPGRERDAFAALLARPYRFAVIDGVTEALSVFGASGRDEDEFTGWQRQTAKVIAHRTGAAVVLVDHVTKSNDNRGRFAIGTQAKLNSLTGCAFTVEVLSPIAPGQRGTLVMRVGKDRPGWVRNHSGKWRKEDRTQEAALIDIDSRQVGGIVATVRAPSETTTTPQVTHSEAKLAVYEWFRNGEGRLGDVTAARAVTGSGQARASVYRALPKLTEDGLLVIVSDEGKTKRYSLNPDRDHDSHPDPAPPP